MSKYSFRYLGDSVPSLSSKDTQLLLMKWGVKDTLRVYQYAYDQAFQVHDSQTFLKDFFADKNVAQSLSILTSVRGTWSTLSGTVKSVKASAVPCTATSMAFFDRLYSANLLRPDGSLLGCIPEYHGPYTITQEMTKALLIEDSDKYDVFSKEERSELLFAVFLHLVMGGPLNQYEDNIKEYFELTKNVYKDLVAVAKDPKSGAVVVHSLVFKVSQVEDCPPLFPGDDQDHVQNFLYVIVNPLKRTISVLYNAWCG